MANRELEAAASRLADARTYLKVDTLREEAQALDARMAEPDFWDDTQTAQKVSKEAADLKESIAEYEAAAQQLEDAQAAYELSEEDEAFAGEYEAGMAKLDTMLDGLEVSSWFSGRFDRGGAILSINPGQGGLEAQDWTEMLYRMYKRYAEAKGWRVSGSIRPPSRWKARTPSACSPPRLGSIGSCASLPRMTRSAATPPSQGWRCSPSCRTISKWRSIPLTCGWTCIAPPVPVASA